MAFGAEAPALVAAAGSPSHVIGSGRRRRGPRFLCGERTATAVNSLRFCAAFLLFCFASGTEFASAQHWPDQFLGEYQIADARSGSMGGTPAIGGDVTIHGQGAGAVLTGTCSGCEDGCPACVDPLWLSISADFLWLGRSRVLDDVPFDVKAGVQGNIAFGDPEGRAFEMGYFGVSDQPGDVVFDAGGNTFYLAYESHLHNVDLNYRLDPYWRITTLFGFRWIHQAETFEIQDVATPTNMSIDEVRNDLVGAQIGFKMPLWDRGGWFRAEVLCKAGAYHNEMNLRSDFRIGGASLYGTSNFNTVSYAGEVHLSAVWQIHRNLLFRTEYVGLWLTDVATVADNLDVALGTSPWLLDQVNYHGGNLGIEMRW